MNRVDVELVARGLAQSRSAAQRLIADGAVRLAGGEAVSRPAMRIDASVALELRESDETRFVSRAGAKLDHALRDSGLAVLGHTVLDLGMSTGGFADCLLGRGASRVIGIEVGHGQLHPRLVKDSRVHCLEHFNARELSARTLSTHLGDDYPEGGFVRVVGDLSFISLARIVGPLDSVLASGAQGLLLVKPQFELEARRLDKAGRVRHAADRQAAVDVIVGQCEALGWQIPNRLESALPGTDGNQETFIHFIKS